MSLLDQLSGVVPFRGRTGAGSPIRAVAERYAEEIATAQERGYSWPQILAAVRQDMGEEWRSEWRSWDVRDHYRAVMKERKR